MRIALIYDAVFPYIKGGGERIFHELARQLAQRHEVHLLGMKFWDGPRVQQMEDNLWLHGVCPAMQLYKKGDNRRRTIRQALWFAAKLPVALAGQNKFDLIDCMSTPYFPLYATRLALLRQNTPLVSTWLEIWREGEWERYMGKVSGWVAGQVERQATRLPDRIIAISEHTRRGLETCRVARDRIHVIEPGIHWHRIGRVEPSGEATDILYVGRLIREKGVDLLLESLVHVKERCPGCRCSIVGDGPERQSLERLRNELGLKECVDFAGFYDEAEKVYRRMKSARVLALPSRREGFGIVVMEAAACGLPVVTIEEPNNASVDLVRQGDIGFISRPEPGALAQGLITILSDDNARTEMKERAVEWSRHYDWEAVGERYEDFYQKVIDESKFGRRH